MKNNENNSDLNRRNFLATSGVAASVAMAGAVELKAQEPANKYDAKASPPVNLGLIGCGPRGREILGTLAVLPNAPVVAVCDTYGAFLRRGKRAAPKATGYEDYKELLADKNVQGVIIATPTHQHKQIVIDALEAGKHVFCEAPIAHTIEDARAIAQAAKKAVKQHFQVGLQNRSDPQRSFLLEFIRTSAMGTNAMARAQWHKKQSWRRDSPVAARRKEINWRLEPKTSLGLIGEIGIHQMDATNWTYNELPTSVTGFGSIRFWNDGRKVADTVQAIIEYKDGLNLAYDATLANSFDADYEMYYGSDSAVMIRGSKAWMFKEVDSPLLGWEVYARKDQFYEETGITLLANATKIADQGGDAEDAARRAVEESALYHALGAFVNNSHKVLSSVEDYITLFGGETGLEDYLTAELAGKKEPYANYMDGYNATICAIKANEAIANSKRIDFSKEWFAIS